MSFFIHFIKESVNFYNEAAIYLLIGFIVAGLLHIVFPESIIRRHLGKDSFGSLLKATLFGIPLPICSCGVVPVATSLKNSGASKGATVSFLITTPQIGPDSFMITYSFLGWVFGVFRIITAFIIGLSTGVLVNIFGKKESGTMLPMADMKKEETIAERAKGIVHYVIYELMGSIANSLLVGVVIAGLISVIIPDGFFERHMGNTFMSMLFMLVLGIPLYVCASASTPIVASLVMKGMSPGAALVFLLTGPATNTMSLSVISKVVGKKSTAIYLTVIAVASIAMGYVMNLFVAKFGFSKIIMMHDMSGHSNWIMNAGSGIFTVMLAWYYIDTKIIQKLKKGQIDMAQKVILNVSGMNCMHCSGSVKKAVESVEGTSNVNVDLEGKKVVFDIIEAGFVDKVKTAIAFAGFTVENS